MLMIPFWNCFTMFGGFYKVKRIVLLTFSCSLIDFFTRVCSMSVLDRVHLSRSSWFCNFLGFHCRMDLLKLRLTQKSLRLQLVVAVLNECCQFVKNSFIFTSFICEELSFLQSQALIFSKQKENVYGNICWVAIFEYTQHFNLVISSKVLLLVWAESKTLFRSLNHLLRDFLSAAT